MEKENVPQGIVAVLVDNAGREIANATDFDLCHPGGFTLRQTQEIRARENLAMTAVRNLSSPILSGAITRDKAELILRNMCLNGCKVIIVPVGYGG